VVTMRLTDQAKDKYVAPERSAFTAADIRDLSHISAGQHQWVRSFVINSTVRGSFAPLERAKVYNFLRRIDSAIREYALARDRTLAYLADRDKISEYLAAIAHWEVALSSAYLAWLLIPYYEARFGPGDGSVCQRFNRLYNRSKHVETALACDPPQLPPDGTLTVWLKNDGLHCTDGHLTFNEIAAFIEALARVADAAQDPPTMVEKLTALLSELNASAGAHMNAPELG
jgi:hypothetical protein